MDCVHIRGMRGTVLIDDSIVEMTFNGVNM